MTLPWCFAMLQSQRLWCRCLCLSQCGKKPQNWFVFWIFELEAKNGTVLREGHNYHRHHFILLIIVPVLQCQLFNRCFGPSHCPGHTKRDHLLSSLSMQVSLGRLNIVPVLAWGSYSSNSWTNRLRHHGAAVFAPEAETKTLCWPIVQAQLLRRCDWIHVYKNNATPVVNSTRGWSPLDSFCMVNIFASFQ